MATEKKQKKRKLPKATRPHASKGTLKKVLRYLGAYRYLLLLSALLALIHVAATLYVPILIGDAIDLAVEAGQVDMDGILSLSLQALVFVGIAALANWLMSMINNRMTYGVVRDLRRDAFDRLQILPMSYLDSHPRGDTVSRVIADVDTFAEGLLLGFTQLFTGILTILGTLVFMLVIRWQIALAVLLITPVSLLVARFIGSRTHRYFRNRSQVQGEQTAFIDENLSGIRVVKAFAHEDEAEREFGEINRRLEKASLSAIFFSSLTNPTTRFVNSLVYAVVALVGAMIAIQTKDASTAEAIFTVGNLSALLSYTNQYTKPFNEISGVITEFQNALACADRVFALIEETPEPPDAVPAEGAESSDRPKQRVDFSHVCFRYVPEKPLIEDFNLSVTPGQRIAIVGPTGCGKTTLINLILRFYDVTGGSIALNGRDIRQMPRKELRQNIGMVLQETWLRNATVRENIAMGRPDAGEDEIIAAAKAAKAHSFIRRLPQGYDTVIGEGGGSLSQGQRQLLCIARVMLALPPMLILDEATSSIDTHTEQKIQSAFARMMQGRTSFIVAHRLSTIQSADVILVMKDGHIIEKGDHETLLAQNGFYANLYRSQFCH